MTTETLIQKLDGLQDGTDFTDANTYMTLLYGDEQGEEAQQQETQGESQQDQAPQVAQVKAEQSSEAPAVAEKTDEPKVDGVLTKDGKHVIPYDVLDAARKTAREEAARRAELEKSNQALVQQIEALKQGKPQDPAAQQPKKFSQERIDAVRDDFPEMAELMESQNLLAEQLEQAKAQAPVVQGEQVDVQAFIDQRPALAKWQASGGLLWQEAVRIDEGLQNNPAWAGKPLEERFAEVERLVAEQAGIPIQAPVAAPATQQATKPIPEKVKPAPSPSLTDFNGSAPIKTDGFDGDLPVGKAVDRAMTMDLEAIYRAVGVNL